MGRKLLTWLTKLSCSLFDQQCESRGWLEFGAPSPSACLSSFWKGQPDAGVVTWLGCHPIKHAVPPAVYMDCSAWVVIIHFQRFAFLNHTVAGKS